MATQGNTLITPSDSVDLSPPLGCLQTLDGGAITVLLTDGRRVLYNFLKPYDSIYPPQGRFRRVLATGTTSTRIIASAFETTKPVDPGTPTGTGTLDFSQAGNAGYVYFV